MWGTGRDKVAAWKAEGGYIFPDGKPDRVLSINGRTDNPTPVLADRGGDYQRRHFIPFV
jgi:hypothetical protein